MKNLSIKIKLIIIFIIIKIIPLLIITYIAYTGVQKLDEYLKDSTRFLYNQSKEIIINTANESISDSVKYLDKKSQLSIERLSYEIANNVAQFLYQRDEDILFLSKLELNQNILNSFYNSKKRDIIIHGDYTYDKKVNKWLELNPKELKNNKAVKAELKDNEKEFNLTNPLDNNKITIPIYKEISYFDLNGNEKYKVSQIDKNLKNISKRENTYINSEIYFNKLSSLKNGEIYVSKVIGEYIGSKVIGTFSEENARKQGIEFEPKKYAYAGKENPVGKKFKGIIRFITPIFKKNKKVGYLSLALDHEHIMQFTDTTNPTSVNAKQDIADASVGNYAFMWDNKGRNISHPRDYFIVGYDKKTGEQVVPWLSKSLSKEIEISKEEPIAFLKKYPIFKEQSLNKKPNFKQLLKDGNIGLDCRYLNFAPQCQGWMQVTREGGYGSFIILWSKVWKLTTAASIPYFTGQYKGKRGFGFVTIGANVNEFHSAADETRLNVNKILKSQTENIEEIVKENEYQINNSINRLMNELSFVTVLMVLLIIIIALWLSNYISTKINNLLLGTNKFSNNELDYRIKITSDDEIGKLEKSFNNMARKIENLINDEKQLNESLELKVKKGIAKVRKQEELLIQQSKLASMGEMIGNIAHQWRQPLNALGLVVQNIHFSYQLDDLNDKFMDKSVNKANMLIDNMSKTIDDFRNFFKPNKVKELFNLNDSIDKSVNLLNAAFNHNQIEIIKKFDKKDIFIEGYLNEFSQVIVNVLNNAKDAFSESTVSNAKIIVSTYEKDSFAFVEIIDNATGIDDESIEKVFDPYFTTKEEGQGIGIGLYMSKTIIEKNMNSKLFVYNNKLNGATFVIQIPLSNKKLKHI